MELNKDHALRLWSARFGRKVKVADYTGRRMDKSSYNDRNSKYGWNVDHILPQSRGGKTADHNLICCHILTNDEKADCFPCFTANNKKFEIRRIQNHYEIFPRDAANHGEVNFFDAGQAVEFWEEDCEVPEHLFVGYVKIRMTSREPLENGFFEKFRGFLIKLFHTSAVFTDGAFQDCSSPSTNRIFTVINFDIPLKHDAQNLLDQCVLLNTFGQYYFRPKYGCELRIYCGERIYDPNPGFTVEDINYKILHRMCGSLDPSQNYFLAIHGMIKTNTTADSELNDNDYHTDAAYHAFNSGEGFFPYDKVFPNVKTMLEKNNLTAGVCHLLRDAGQQASFRTNDWR